MQIQDSNVSMIASHSATTKYVKTEQLRAWVGDVRPDFEGTRTPVQGPATIVRLSEEALRKAAEQPVRREAPADMELDPTEDFKSRLLALVIAAMTGHEIKVVSPSSLMKDMQCGDGDVAGQATAARPAEGEPQPEREGWGVEYDSYEHREEHENMSFQTQVDVTTADGKKIQVDVSLQMSRDFMEEKRVSIRAGDAKKVDPLVINFNGAAAELTQTKYAFDLDSDGKTEQVSFVGPSSGFLALDKDGDGKISNGSELFGPTSGDGFSELAAYDEDGNQWIDESDSIYDKLRIWSKDTAGNDSLVALGMKGVGAIYLGHLGTSFDIKAPGSNELLGSVVSSGVYLTESGGAGTVQQVDLAVA